MQGESPFKGKTGVQRMINAARYSLEGMAAAARHENAFRQELLLAKRLSGAVATGTPDAVRGSGDLVAHARANALLVVEMLAAFSAYNPPY